MNNNGWINLIETKREEIIEVGTAAYRKHLESDNHFIIEINEKGDVYFYENANDGQSWDSYNNKAIVIKDFYNNNTPDNYLMDDEMIYALSNNGYSERYIKSLINKAEREDTSIELICMNHKNKRLQKIVEQELKDNLDVIAENNGCEEMDQAIDRIIQYLEQEI